MPPILRIALALGAVFFLAGCAGPTSPLGAPWITTASELTPATGGELRKLMARFSGEKPQITFYPKRQILHESRPISFRVYDPNGIRPDYRLIVMHNGVDVTKSFLRQAKIKLHPDGRTLTAKIPTTTLSPVKEHLIEVGYTTANELELLAYGWYEPPHCDAYAKRTLATTGNFRTSGNVIRLIEKASQQTGFNPAFTAALIAQESSFNPRSVSWAKAIGLTQITSAADRDLAERFGDWPRYPGVEDLSAPHVKLLVATGRMHSRNEWRLDAEKSITGGLAYLELVIGWWSQKENEPRTAELSVEDRTKLVLASYNSGYMRVQSALGRKHEKWLEARDLREARKYVNRIFSLCDTFSEESTDDEGEEPDESTT